MKIKNNKGFTGVDISIALVIFVLFVGIIVTLVYNFSIASKALNRKSEAMEIAIQKIEQLKNTAYNEIEETPASGIETVDGGYTINTVITRYRNSEFAPQDKNENEDTDTDTGIKDRIIDVIKIAKVTVSYTVQKEVQKVELSSVITKED